MSLTGFYDTDLYITLHMRPEDVLILTQVSKYWHDLCDNRLWRELIWRDFKIDRLIGEPKEQYRFLSTVKYGEALELGRIDGLELYHRKDPVCLYEALEAIDYGHDEMFWWILDQGVEPDKECLERAILNGRDEIFKRLWHLGLRPNNTKIQPGSQEILLQLIDSGYFPNESWADWALFSNNFESLDFLYQRGIVPSPTAFEVSCEFYCMDLLEWAESHEIRTETTWINTAMAYGHIEMVKWLYHRGLRPDPGTSISIYHGDLNALIWLEEHDLDWFDSKMSDYALELGLLHLIEWLLDREIEPTAEGLIHASPEVQPWVVRYRKMKLNLSN